MLGECQQRQVGLLPSQRRKEQLLMLERTIAASSKEQTATGTLKGVHEEGFSGLRAAFFPPHAKARGTQKRTEMEEHRDTLENGSTSSVNDTNGANSVQSVERALDLLEFLAQSPNRVGISELSVATGQPVATVHRLLMTLVARKYVARDSRSRRYTLGSAAHALVNIEHQIMNWGEAPPRFFVNSWR